MSNQTSRKIEPKVLPVQYQESRPGDILLESGSRWLYALMCIVRLNDEQLGTDSSMNPEAGKRLTESLAFSKGSQSIKVSS